MSNWQRRNPYHGFHARTRAAILQRDPVCRCPGCTSCTPTGCTRRSTEADHRINLAAGGTNHAANGQGMCSPCHHIKTSTEITAGKRRRYRPTDPHPGRL